MQMLNDNLRTATHTAIVAVFFALLNVDANLKQRIYDMFKGNACKIERFLIDLKFNLILWKQNTQLLLAVWRFHHNSAQNPFA